MLTAQKHVKQSRNNGIINCPTQLHLVDHFYKIFGEYKKYHRYKECLYGYFKLTYLRESTFTHMSWIVTDCKCNQNLKWHEDKCTTDM
jgi:hypothetical protein